MNPIEWLIYGAAIEVLMRKGGHWCLIARPVMAAARVIGHYEDVTRWAV